MLNAIINALAAGNSKEQASFLNSLSLSLKFACKEKLGNQIYYICGDLDQNSRAVIKEFHETLEFLSENKNES